MTDREKIKEIMKQAQNEIHRMFYEGVMRVRNGELRSFSTSDLNAIKPYDDIYADAFIAAGFGDVREYKHRAEVAEKALKLVSECDELSDAFCELIGEDNCDFKCNTCLYNYFLQHAEREIEEGNEDDR